MEDKHSDWRLLTKLGNSAIGLGAGRRHNALSASVGDGEIDVTYLMSKLPPLETDIVSESNLRQYLHNQFYNAMARLPVSQDDYLGGLRPRSAGKGQQQQQQERGKQLLQKLLASEMTADKAQALERKGLLRQLCLDLGQSSLRTASVRVLLKFAAVHPVSLVPHAPLVAANAAAMIASSSPAAQEAAARLLDMLLAADAAVRPECAKHLLQPGVASSALASEEPRVVSAVARLLRSIASTVTGKLAALKDPSLLQALVRAARAQAVLGSSTDALSNVLACLGSLCAVASACTQLVNRHRLLPHLATLLCDHRPGAVHAAAACLASIASSPEPAIAEEVQDVLTNNLEAVQALVGVVEASQRKAATLDALTILAALTSPSSSSSGGSLAPSTARDVVYQSLKVLKACLKQATAVDDHQSSTPQHSARPPPSRRSLTGQLLTTSLRVLGNAASGLVGASAAAELKALAAVEQVVALPSATAPQHEAATRLVAQLSKHEPRAVASSQLLLEQLCSRIARPAGGRPGTPAPAATAAVPEQALGAYSHAVAALTRLLEADASLLDRLEGAALMAALTQQAAVFVAQAPSWAAAKAVLERVLGAVAALAVAGQRCSSQAQQVQLAETAAAVVVAGLSGELSQAAAKMLWRIAYHKAVSLDVLHHQSVLRAVQKLLEPGSAEDAVASGVQLAALVVQTDDGRRKLGASDVLPLLLLRLGTRGALEAEVAPVLRAVKPHDKYGVLKKTVL